MRREWGNHIIIVLLVLISFTQCQRPMNVLKRDQMLEVTKDMLLAEAYLRNNVQTDSIAALYYEGVLEKHGISKEKYDSSLVWYGERSHRLDKIYEEVEKVLQKEKLELDTLYTDSVNMERIRFKPRESLWKGPNRLYLSGKQETYYYNQEVDINAASLAPKDTLMWRAAVTSEDLTEDGLHLTFNLLMLNEDGSYYTRLKSISVPDSLYSYRHLIVLPDSIPTNVSSTLYMILQKKRGQVLFLDHFYLDKLEHIQSPEVVDSLKISNDSLEISNDVSEDIEVIKEMPAEPLAQEELEVS